MHQPFLFSAFVKYLRQHDLKAWRLILFCITLQLIFIIVKLEATPFFLFGMYSEKMSSADTISKFNLLINDVPVINFNPSYREVNLLETTVANYVEMKRNNNTDPVKIRIESRYPLIYGAGFYPSLAPRLYNDKADMAGFRTWLKAKCLGIAGLSSGSISIVETKFLDQEKGGRLIQINHELLETF